MLKNAGLRFNQFPRCYFKNWLVSSEFNNHEIKAVDFMKLGMLGYNITGYHKNPLNVDYMVHKRNSPPP